MNTFMGQGTLPPEPKPFFWIELGKESPKRENPLFHDRFSGLTGNLELEIEVVSDYLYVGSGVILLDEARDRVYYAFSRSGERLVIPGMGIKGAIRAIVEAISNSCLGGRIARGERPGRHEDCSKIRPEGGAGPSFCPACRLFGAQGYRGQVHFNDAFPMGEVKSSIIKIADLWPPHRADKGRKFYQTKRFILWDERPQKNHRFLEAVPKGSRFRTRLHFENAEAAEMGLLVRALGFDLDSFHTREVTPLFPVKLGGAKPRCLGAVHFRPVTLSLLPGEPAKMFQALSHGLETGPWHEHFIAWLQEDSLLAREAWQKFRKEAPQINTESCPRGLY